MSALLGAAAGFFISGSELMIAATPNDGLRVILLFALYWLLFAGPPIASVTLRGKPGTRSVRLWLLACLYGLCYWRVAGKFVWMEVSSQNGFSMGFHEKLAGPILALPLLWFAIYLFDDAVTPIGRSIARLLPVSRTT